MPADWVSTARAAALLGVSKGRVRQLLSSGQLPGRKIGRDWLIRSGDLRRFEALPRGSPGRPRALKGRRLGP
jgi:excisionase family DNA binding protein